MLTITAIRPHVYAGKQRRVGEVYMATERDAKILIGMHNARMSAVAVEDDPTTTPVETASVAAEVEISPRTGKPKRGYKRRDMKAEE